MEATAKAVKANGGQVMGVVPTLLEERGRVSTLLDVIFPTVNLSDRKDLMLQEADILVALPGGIGTLDEISMYWLPGASVTTTSRSSCTT